MQHRPSRRRFLLAVSGVAGLAGCVESSSAPTSLDDLGGTPRPTPPPTVTDSPGTLLLEAAALPGDDATTWEETNRRSVQSGLSVHYEVYREGEFSHQVNLEVTRRQTVDGAHLDHRKLVELYEEEHDTTVGELGFGDVGSLVTFAGEAHAIVAFRNVVVHVASYDGPSEQVVEVARRQVQRLEREVPRPG